uniref:Uncharacterized protein n=1 Tax=Knipowitschia caucasica TaxID=637954 RepID=A0AAV2K1H7_KNICA
MWKESSTPPPQWSVGSTFTVAEQSGAGPSGGAGPAGSTWYAISSALANPRIQPAQPKHTRTDDQNNAKQTHTGHTEEREEREGREGVW